jgi:Protein tyrosine and serine/threonine kinase
MGSLTQVKYNQTQPVKIDTLLDVHILPFFVIFKSVRLSFRDLICEIQLAMKSEYQYLGGLIGPEVEHRFWILDQRRMITVAGDADDLSGEFEQGADILDQFIHEIFPDTVMIHVHEGGEYVTFSSTTEDDRTRFVMYPPFENQPEKTRAKTLTRSSLHEEKRINWIADLVSYTHEPGKQRLAVFKCALHEPHVERVWTDAHIMSALNGHPAIVPFEYFIVDDEQGCLVGYTSKFVPGGTLQDNHASIVFRLSWLIQLTQIVDDINLKYGIMHRDIAARNILVDPDSKQLLLFDFNNAMQIGSSPKNSQFDGYPDVDGVIFTIYELLTIDMSFRERKVFWEHDVSPIENMEQWPIKAKLEPGLDVATIRGYLFRWASGRRTTRFISHFSEASKPIEIPCLPELDINDGPDQDSMETYVYDRKSAIKNGVPVVGWQRPRFEECRLK